MSTIRRVEVSGVPLVAKSASGEQRRRLRREAELLGHLDGLPVVALVALRESDDRTDLVTRDAGEYDMSASGGLSPEQLLEALGATIDAVARLHAAGWSHGAICSEHVVIDREGRVTLCSLGSARPTAASDDAVEIDREQVRSLVGRVLETGDPAWCARDARRWRRLTRRLRRLGRSGSRASLHLDSDLELTADGIASARRELHEHRRDRTAPRTWDGLTRAPLGLLTGIVGLGLTALLWAAVGATEGGAGAAVTVAGATGPRCAAPLPGTHADLDADGCPELIELHGNQIRTAAMSIRAGRDGDQIAIGSLTCDRSPEHQVVLLRPTTGEVFGFDEWPTPRRPTAARLLGSARGATALRTDLSGDCRMVTLRRADGTDVDLVTAANPESGSEAGPPRAPIPAPEDDTP